MRALARLGLGLGVAGADVPGGRLPGQDELVLLQAPAGAEGVPRRLADDHPRRQHDGVRFEDALALLAGVEGQDADAVALEPGLGVEAVADDEEGALGLVGLPEQVAGDEVDGVDAAGGVAEVAGASGGVGDAAGQQHGPAARRLGGRRRGRHGEDGEQGDRAERHHSEPLPTEANRNAAVCGAS